MDNLRRLGGNVGRRPRSAQDPRERPRAGSRHRAARHAAPPIGRRRWPRRLLVFVNVICLIGLCSAGGAYAYVQYRLDQIKRMNVAGLSGEGTGQSANDGASIPPFTLLVIGSDTRNLGAGGSAAFGNDQSVQGQRSDSIILVRVVPKTRSLALLSIPRDTLETIPGYSGLQRVNTAFNSGTPSLLVNVLNSDFGIQVNHVVEFNFDTFQQVADAVGGVEQWFPVPAMDTFSNLNVGAGCVNLTGAQALAFVRSREYQYYLNGQWHYQLFPESDLARIQRQQAFTRDLLHKAKSVAPTNVFEINNIISGITKNLTIDSTLSNGELLSLAEDYRSANLSGIPSYTYPTTNSTAVPGALDPDVAAGQAVIQQWLNVGSSPATPAPNTNSTPPTTDIAPRSISVAVQNGSGVGGQAAAAGAGLSTLGYSVTVSGDAPNFGLATTQIEYSPDSRADAQQVQSEIIGNSALVADSALKPTPYNVEVVTGQSYGGIKGSSASSSSSTSAATTATTIGSPAYNGTATVNPDSSSIYQGVYVPPGLSPGQTPQTCGE
jgi:LCP family protein required for cell wall assembly